jgi:hypothetical protein
MNPYLEQEDVWQDFHGNFLERAREALNAQVLPHYFVKVNEHIYIHDLAEEESRQFVGRADVSVAPASAREEGAATGLIEAPARIRLPIPDVERVAFLEVRDRRNRQVVTVIELLSPSNKRRGPDRDQYEAKRGQLLTSSVHFVEIDLLRGGPRMPMDGLPPCEYCVLVSTAEERPQGAIWPIRLREPLPPVPIPLRSAEPPATVNLQEVLHRAYDAAGYGIYIYDDEPVPPLAAEDAEWARQFLPAR